MSTAYTHFISPLPKGKSSASTSKADTSFTLSRANTNPRRQRTTTRSSLSRSSEGGAAPGDLAIQPKGEESNFFSLPPQAKEDTEKTYNSERFHFFQRMLWVDLCSNFCPHHASYIRSLLETEAEETEEQKNPTDKSQFTLTLQSPFLEHSKKNPHPRNHSFQLPTHSYLR